MVLKVIWKIRKLAWQSNVYRLYDSFHLWYHPSNTRIEISLGARSMEITNKARRRCLFEDSCNSMARSVEVRLKNNKSHGSWYQWVVPKGKDTRRPNLFRNSETPFHSRDNQLNVYRSSYSSENFARYRQYSRITD